MSVFTGQGWRHKDQPGCFSIHPNGRWRCERAVRHNHWHGCDNSTWAPAAAESDKRAKTST